MLLHLPGEPLLQIKVIIHDLPLREIQDPDVRCGFLVKCVVAVSTENDGKRADFRRHEWAM